MEIITKLGPYDVLFGRGSGPNDHEGNIRFRKLVAERKAEYMATNHRMTKARIAREIVDTVLRENGRFLKKIEQEDAKVVGLPDGVDAWTGVDDETIMEKAKQALRQNTNKTKGPSEFGQKSPVQAVISTSMQQHPQDAISDLPLPILDLGFDADDLEPIPIPSAEFPGQTAVPSPSPGRQLKQHEVIAWEVMKIGSSDEHQSSGSIVAIQGQDGSGINVTSSSSQLHQRSHYSYAHPMSQNNLMLPPAARVPSSRRSSNTSTLKSMEMSDLMDSFSRTHLTAATSYEHKNLGNSTESMGTIEPMSVGSEANMSFATMNSSVFSVLRPEEDKRDAKGDKVFPTPDNERSFRELEQEEAPSYIRVYPVDNGLDSDFMSSTKIGLASDASMSIAELGAARRRQSSVILRNVKEEEYSEVYDAILDEVGRPVMGVDSGLEAMGSSSLNLLKGMLLSQDSLPPGGSAHLGRQDDSHSRSKSAHNPN